MEFFCLQTLSQTSDLDSQTVEAINRLSCNQELPFAQNLQSQTRFWASFQDASNVVHPFVQVFWSKQKELVACALWRRVFEQAELDFVVTNPNYQKRALATSLLNESHNQLREIGVESVSLEVSSNNKPALAVYRRLGYQTTNLRKRYYGNGDDALILSLLLET